MGLPHVVSLKNGTAGWTLAGLQLERGANRLDLPQPEPAALADAEAFARRICAEDGVDLIDVDALQKLIASGQCAYFVDVRTDSEFADGHIPGFTWFPGGQAVQRADDLVAVRNAQIVFCCDGLVRAAVTGSWFRQMGFPHVAILDGGTTAWRQHGLDLVVGLDRVEPFGLAAARAAVRSLSPSELHSRLADKPTILFVNTSREFAHGHVPGAQWLSRSWLELRIREFHEPFVITDADGRSAPLAAATLQDIGYTDVAYLDGGTRAWESAGLPVEKGLTGVMEPPDDVVASGLQRSSAEAIEYLRWETALGPPHR
jgi:rhodanese-related sulfurtransferase